MYRDYMCDFICILAWLESDRGTVSQIFYFVLLVLKMVSYLLVGFECVCCWPCGIIVTQTLIMNILRIIFYNIVV